jgi:hypothetical protein
VIGKPTGRDVDGRPRILIVNFNFDNLNPTVRLWPYLFLEFGDITFFGPGHVRDDRLREGVAACIRRTGPFDAIVIDDHVVVNSLPDSNPATNARVYARSYIHRFSPPEAIRVAPALYDGALASGLPVLVSQFESDCYPMRQSHFELLRRSNLFIIGWGGELYPWLRDVDAAGEGDWIRRANDRWKTLVEECAHRVISMPAMVDADEFCLHPLARRRHEWSVPGTRYRSRAAARRALARSGKTVAGGKHYLAMKLLSGLRFPLYSNRALLDLYNGGFCRTLRNSQFVYTCGSAMRLAIRKFFEIPAAGAVLVCDPCHGFEALGFRNGENALACTPDDLAERLTGPVDLDAAQAIATAGQNMVRRAHSISARASQMRRAVERILAGNFRGAFWCRGEFRLR